MTDAVNILILSCGTRNKIIQYFRRELGNKGKVIATDCSKLAPALYDADKYYIVPKIGDEGYLDTILNICRENNVKGVLSLIDPELNLLAKNKDKFIEIGVTPIISDYDIVETCFNKYSFYKFLISTGFKTVRTYVEKESFFRDVESGIVNYPVFVKPVKGSASININKITSKNEIELLFEKHDDLIIQEYMDGIEYGADVYIDLISSEPVAIFTKEKIKMRAGETDKSVSVKDDILFDLIKRFVTVAGFKGIIDIDIFKIEGEYFISEVNPRFGGGYPHAYECGINIPKMIINNLNGKENKREVGSYKEGVYMMKYNEIKIIGKEND